MFRLRRFRVFLAVALLVVFSIYEFSGSKDWNVPELEGLKSFGFKHDGLQQPKHKPPSGQRIESDDIESKGSPASVRTSSVALPVVQSIETAASIEELADTTTSTPAAERARTTVTGEEFLAKQPTLEQDFGQHGQARLDVDPPPASGNRPRWRPQKEHFPIDKVIRVPGAEQKPLRKIQHTFRSESNSKKTDRIKKQTAVKESFKHAWSGYKKYAMGHDELKPVSNKTADPFNGWGATLVDALDTMWIMGLKTEFEEALEDVSSIDFKTSRRKDIPMFETTIRYMGGLIGAYDISGRKYSLLLDKAVELADVIMGAFDTPNRMPIPYYQWAPSYASQPHRASSRIVMAELGSLAVEFTRLSQITKEDKYYDAIARVTDALEDWQMTTSYPGVWPVRLDASGCKKREIKHHALNSNSEAKHTMSETIAEDNSVLIEPAMGSGEGSNIDSNFAKRQLDDAPADNLGSDSASNPDPQKNEPPKPAEDDDEDDDDEDDRFVDCEPRGLQHEPNTKKHTYSIAAMADSTYEYFPKMFALLGGNADQYKTMYNDAMEVIRDDFLFRPMIKESKRKLLFLAKHDISPDAREKGDRKVTHFEGTHLGCFAGGMFALGAKVFNIPSDMEYAARLTDGCVWAYESMPAGVMAEEFELVPCDDMEQCPWDEGRWHELLDPFQKERFEAVELYNQQHKKFLEKAEFEQSRSAHADVSSKVKRSGQGDPEAVAGEEVSRTIRTEQEEEEEDEEVQEDTRPVLTPKVALSHAKYVQARISEERLPPSYTRIQSPAYKLRPEAIESVFIMYRLTGDDKWREKGWKMFLAVEKATRTASAHAMIKDVTSALGELEDTMESFWLAETLKYFYLLFSEEDVLSLDEWVLNTEAHPMRLPVKNN